MAERKSAFQKFSKQELIQVLESLQKKYKLMMPELKKLASQGREIQIPLSVFCRRITVFESVCKYLKENKNFALHQIARSLNRDDRTIWATYHRARKKHPLPFKEKKGALLIPARFFGQRTRSMLEAAVEYLREQHDLSYKEISILLHRDERTIWTVYQRVRKKQ